MIINKIYNDFNIQGNLVNINSYGDGHINDTYLIETNTNKYIIQRINNKVFKNPNKLMKNFSRITKWMEDHIINYQGIKLIETKKGKKYLRKDNNYFRCYKYIENCICFEKVDDLNVIYEMGKALGTFDKTLESFPLNKLYNVIPNFHNGRQRYNNFKKSVKINKSNRKYKVLKEIFFIYKRNQYFDIINNEIKNKTIRIMPIHNDPKMNNILIDKITQKQICLIDLDTVMPGTILYDYGDAVRSIILNCKEDEEDIDKVELNFDKFDWFNMGFFEVMKESLTLKEKELLIDSIIIITLECGMRFLTDYIDGDKYFKIDDKEQNLRRARVCLKQVALLEQNKDKLDLLIKKIG